MSKFVRYDELTKKDKTEVIDMLGKIIVWCQEKRRIDFMSEQLKMKPCEIEYNIDEILYVLRKYVGMKRFIRTLFIK